MSLRKIIRENIENITGTDQLFDIDGFEFVNLSIKIKKQNDKKDFDLSRQDNIIKLKPN